MDVGKTVDLLIGAVKADRIQTKKLCQAVVNLQISENWVKGAGQEKGGVMQPMHCNQVEDQGKAVQPRTSTVPRRLFAAESAPVPSVAAPSCPLPSSCAPVTLMPLAAPIHYPNTECGVEGVVARTQLQPHGRTGSRVEGMPMRVVEYGVGGEGVVAGTRKQPQRVEIGRAHV